MPRRSTATLCVVGLLVASAIVVGLSAGAARATTYPAAAYHMDGTVANEFSANSVALLDLNGDGVADLAVGAPFNGTGAAGSVTFFLSQMVGPTLVPFHQVITVTGSAPGDLFGWSLANVGNVTNGGPVLAVGAPHASPHGHAQAGNLTFFAASPSFNGKPSAWINSSTDGENLGYSLAAAGDLNGDRIGDLVAGAPFCSLGAPTGGCAYVYYGGTGHPALTPSLTFDSGVAGAHFGWSVAGNGSVDGAAPLDLVVGAPNYTSAGLAARGAAYVIRNPAGTVRTSIVPGASAGDQFGFSVAIGDFNGDAIDDIAIGAPYNSGAFSQAGDVSIIYGGSPFKTTIGALLTGRAANEWFGYAVAAGNFHKDNMADLLIGAPGSTVNATGVGRAYAYYGSPAPWTSANLTLVPGVSGANAFGSSLAVGGNFTPEGGPGYVVGDPHFLAGAKANAGRAYVYEGDIVPTLANPIVHGWVCVPHTFTGGTNPCAPLSGFTVTLQSTTTTFTDTSSTNGSFEFNPSPGTYWLNTTLFPYIDNSTSLPLDPNQVTKVFVFPTTIPLVRGNATDAANRTKFAGVTVALYNATNVLVNVTTTDAGGAYAMYIPPTFLPRVGGSSSLQVSMWDDTHYTNHTGVTIRRNQTAYANMFLDRFPVVTGTVYSRTLTRISGATIQATQGSTTVATTTTNNQGAFTLVATNASVPGLLFLNVTCGGACGQYGRTQLSFAVDKNQTYPQVIYLDVDRTPPSSNVWPFLPTYTPTAVFGVSANASDNNGVQQVQLWYRFNNAGSYVEYAADTSAPYTFAFNSTSAHGDGRYAFYTIAVDYAGNTEAAPGANDTWTWVDTVKPTLTVTKPTAGQAFLVSWVNVTWAAQDAGSGLLKVDVELDTGAWLHADLASFMNLTSVPDGFHNVTVNATDRAGNSRTVTVAFSVNTAAPILTFTSPANNSVTATPTVVLTWTITSAGAGITTLQVARDTGSWQTLSTSATVYSFTNLADGSHNLWLHAVTANAQSTKYLRVTVDTTPPTVAITSPTANPWVNTTSEAIAFSASDATSGISSLGLSLDNGTAVNVTGQTTYTVTGLTEGHHRAQLTATDRAGNTATATVDFRVDTTPPTVAFSTPADGATVSSSTVAVQWLVTDAGSGLSSVTISLDGGTAQGVTPGGTQAYSGLADGPHTVVIKATDAAGNVRTTSLGFTVNTQLLGNNALAYGLIVAVVVVVVVIALVVWRMRRPKARETPKEEPPKTPDEEKRA